MWKELVVKARKREPALEGVMGLGGAQGSTCMYGPARKGGEGGQNQKGKTNCSSLPYIIRNVTCQGFMVLFMAINNNGGSESYVAAMDN